MAGDAFGILLPSDRAWAWWTRTEVFSGTRLPKKAAPAEVRPSAFDSVLSKQLVLKRMTLVLVQPRAEHQARVLAWAGQDTEQIADVLWTAPHGDTIWNVPSIVEALCDERWLETPDIVVPTLAERLLVLRDGYVHCAIARDSASSVVDRIQAVAATWKIRTNVGDPNRAWC